VSEDIAHNGEELFEDYEANYDWTYFTTPIHAGNYKDIDLAAYDHICSLSVKDNEIIIKKIISILFYMFEQDVYIDDISINVDEFDIAEHMAFRDANYKLFAIDRHFVPIPHESIENNHIRIVVPAYLRAEPIGMGGIGVIFEFDFKKNNDEFILIGIKKTFIEAPRDFCWLPISEYISVNSYEDVDTNVFPNNPYLSEEENEAIKKKVISVLFYLFWHDVEYGNIYAAIDNNDGWVSEVYSHIPLTNMTGLIAFLKDSNKQFRLTNIEEHFMVRAENTNDGSNLWITVPIYMDNIDENWGTSAIIGFYFKKIGDEYRITAIAIDS